MRTIGEFWKMRKYNAVYEACGRGIIKYHVHQALNKLEEIKENERKKKEKNGY